MAAFVEVAGVQRDGVVRNLAVGERVRLVPGRELRIGSQLDADICCASAIYGGRMNSWLQFDQVRWQFYGMSHTAWHRGASLRTPKPVVLSSGDEFGPSSGIVLRFVENDDAPLYRTRRIGHWLLFDPIRVRFPTVWNAVFAAPLDVMRRAEVTVFPSPEVVLPAMGEQQRVAVETAALRRTPFSPRLLDSGTEANEPWLAVEPAVGPTLQQLLERGREQGGRMDPWVAARIIAGAARGVADAWTFAPLALNPGGIVVDVHGHVTFRGIFPDHARALRDDEARLTSVYAYRAPEELVGHAMTASGAGFALGVMLWEALTGRRPPDPFAVALPGAARAARSVDGRAGALIQRGEHTEHIPPALLEVLDIAFADPELRLSSLVHLADRLDEVVGDRAPTDAMAGWVQAMFPDVWAAEQRLTEELALLDVDDPRVG